MERFSGFSSKKYMERNDQKSRKTTSVWVIHFSAQSPTFFMLEAYLFHTNKLEFVRIESKHVENGYM